MRGTAVIATSNGAFPEFVEDGVSGFLTPPGDSQILAEKLLQLVCDSTLCEQMGKVGHQQAMANFTAEIYAEKVQRLHKNIIAERISHD